MTLIGLIIALFILAIVYWLVTQIPLPIPAWIFNVIFGLIAIVIILQFFGINTGLNFRL